MNAIEINGIVKSYGNVRAVDGISLSVDEGEIFGLIGPDGAGKTTLFRIMTTLMLPDSGSGTVCGLDIVKDFARVRRIIGYMPGKFSLYQDLSVRENLDYFATLFGTTVRENYENIREIYSQIEPFEDRRAGKLSGVGPSSVGIVSRRAYYRGRCGEQEGFLEHALENKGIRRDRIRFHSVYGRSGSV